jgi:hypothetical protein
MKDASSAAMATAKGFSHSNLIDAAVYFKGLLVLLGWLRAPRLVAPASAMFSCPFFRPGFLYAKRSTKSSSFRYLTFVARSDDLILLQAVGASLSLTREAKPSMLPQSPAERPTIAAPGSEDGTGGDYP